MAILTEKDILANIKLSSQGNLSAQKKLYEHAYAKCYNYVKKYATDSSDQTTIFNNAMLDIFKHIYSQKEITHFDGIVTNMVKWRGLDHLRVKYKEVKFAEFTDQHIDLQVVENLEDDSNFGNEMESLLHKLPEKERTVFTLFELDEMSHYEISQLLQISVSYSKWLVFNAKKICRMLGICFNLNC